jgi:type II secretion system protein G
MLRNSKGFTLIELLIVVVIIGILAAIAIPKFAATKEKAYIASMKSDLKNLVTAEEAYFADSLAYTSTVANLSFNTTAGNTPPTITLAGAGWSATIGSSNTTVTCAVFVNTTAAAPATEEGAPACQ